MLAGAASSAALEKQLRLCFFPEPERRICYSEPGATPQNLDMDEVRFTAEYLRAYQEQQIAQGGSPFWKMPLPDANNCAEWQVTAKGRTWIMAKLVGNEAGAVLFSDIAATIDGMTLDDSSVAIANCSTAGGQMATIVDDTNLLYRSSLFKGFTNKGIIIKVVKSPV
ncbi:putative beta- -glucanosyltransferase [Paramyrothecium foliicola]|nr:putative beta- -glucanosyltransferase [Paramyrothecium foliicola]